MRPQFTPLGGIGSTYKDPKTGEMYKYTATGWVKQTEDIKKQTEEKGTFEVKPDEQELIEKLKTGGSSQEQINQGLTERRRVLSNIGETPVKEEPEQDLSNPFGGMTKQEMLRDAFNKGVRDMGELDKLGKVYDLLVGTEEELIELEDLSKLSPEQQEAAKDKIKKLATSKAQELTTVSEREGALGTIGTMESGQEIIDLIEKGISTGPVSGLTREGLSVFGVKIIPGKRQLGKTTIEQDELAAKMTIFTAQFIKAISGTQVSDKEREFLEKALPSESKQEQTNIEGIKAIADFLSNRYSGSINVDLTPLKPRKLIEQNDPLKIFDEDKNPLGI